MRKFALSVLITLFSSAVFSAVEPAVMISLAAPALIAADDGVPGSYSVAHLPSDEEILFALPAEVKASELSLSDMLSGNIIRTGAAFFDAAVLMSGFDSAYVMDADGIASFVPGIDPEKGLAALDVSYSDVSLLYSFGSRIGRAALDGNLRLAVSFFEEPLFTASISTDDIMIDDDDSYSGRTLAVQCDINKTMISAYLDYAGYAAEDLRYLAASMIAQTPLPFFLGLGPGCSADEIISFATEHDAADILDAIAFLSVASSDPDLDELDAISMLVKPSLYVDGELSADIDLEKAMRWCFDIVNLAQAFE